MFEISVIILCLITLALLKIFLSIRFKNIKELNKRVSNELVTLAKKFPNDEKMCKDILKRLNNETVKIKLEPEYTSCLYTIFNNTITIGKFQQDYMKPQTIAHECIHSCQNKRMLWTNFIFTNIYLIYFIIITILEFCNYLVYANIHILILIFSSLIQYVIRSVLENEAMINAKYIAKEYMEENNILNTDEEEILLKEYNKINNIGIPFMNYYTISMNIVKVMIFAFISLV